MDVLAAISMHLESRSIKRSDEDSRGSAGIAWGLPTDSQSLEKGTNLMRSRLISMIVVGTIASPLASAAYVSTPWITDLDIHMDNGVTYFSGFTTGGNCQYNRLEVRDTGDYSNSVENGRRMYALILSARMTGFPIRLGYNDTDGPNCRVAEVWIDW